MAELDLVDLADLVDVMVWELSAGKFFWVLLDAALVVALPVEVADHREFTRGLVGVRGVIKRRLPLRFLVKVLVRPAVFLLMLLVLLSAVMEPGGSGLFVVDPREPLLPGVVDLREFFLPARCDGAFAAVGCVGCTGADMAEGGRSWACPASSWMAAM